jgi:hypothetical protein
MENMIRRRKPAHRTLGISIDRVIAGRRGVDSTSEEPRKSKTALGWASSSFEKRTVIYVSGRIVCS